MDHILVVGVDTVVGANLAAFLSEYATVTGLSLGSVVQIEGCRIIVSSERPDNDPDAWVQHVEPTHVLLCGPAARSNWEGNADGLDDSLAEETGRWAAAAHKTDCRLTMISSDAVFTGPWMFHEEACTAYCRSPEAQAILAAERLVAENCPHALVVRTNAFGWAPDGGCSSWIEDRLKEIESRRLVDQDCIRHAAPILATDLAGILLRAWEEELEGLYHVAGAERVNPMKFVQRLADHFDLPWLAVRRSEALIERATGLGAGECSLQTKKLRKALCVAMPMLSEGLERLVEQDRNGFRDRLIMRRPATRERAA